MPLAPRVQIPSNQAASADTTERKGDSSVPCLVTGTGSTQPSATYDQTKSPGPEWSGTIVVRKHRVGRWKRGRGRGRIFHGLRREDNLERWGW